MNLVDSFPYLDEKHRKEMSGYLDDFFSMAEKPNSLIREIQRTCAD
jgi:hypothetical protein